jgi:hypothetical protein
MYACGFPSPTDSNTRKRSLHDEDTSAVASLWLLSTWRNSTTISNFQVRGEPVAGNSSIGENIVVVLSTASFQVIAFVCFET